MSETNSIAFSQVCPNCVETPNGWQFCEAHLASLKRERDRNNSASSPAVSPVPPTAEEFRDLCTKCKEGMPTYFRLEVPATLDEVVACITKMYPDDSYAMYLTEELARLCSLKDSAPPVAPSVPKCPTNHRHWTEQNPPRDEMKWDWKATHGYNFCPDCGAPLSERNENREVAAPSVGELKIVFRCSNCGVIAPGILSGAAE